MAGEYPRSKSPHAFYLPTAFIALVLLILLFSVDKISASANKDRCNLDTSEFLPAPFNSSSRLICRPVWDHFILRYSRSKDNVLRVIVSTVYTGGWVGMGFSKNGEMVVSSAMVGWIDSDGEARIRQYFLRGFAPAQVLVDQGKLQIIGLPAVALKQMKRNHEALSVFGWGFLTPLGVLFARYCKQWDPVWYYLHVVIQFLGFLIGFAGIMAGISLYDKTHSKASGHRGLGIFIFVLCMLQILAFFIRPQEDTTVHKYWTWYHRWFGWLTVLLAAVNIIHGLKLGDANSVMAAGFAFIACIMLIMFTTLEIIVRVRKRRLLPDSPAFQVYRIQQ